MKETIHKCSMLLDERRQRILDLVTQHGFASLQDLVDHACASESTVRRDLDFLDASQLAVELRGIDYKFSLASRMSPEQIQLGGFELGDTLLYVLAAVLLLEQWIAYRASYHGTGGSAG